MSHSNKFIINILDAKRISIPAGETQCCVDTHARQIVLLSQAGVQERLNVANVLLLNKKKLGWVLDLDWRGTALPTIILIGLCVGFLPITDLLGTPPTWLVKVLLWVGVSVPIAVRRERQQLAIELADDRGILIMETHRDQDTASLIAI